MKIAVYAIALNEEAHVQRFCDAAKDADLIFVADTGSADGTVEALRANGATVSHIHISPWRFDDARNAALAMLPKDVDVCVSLDLDEILQPGWRDEIERLWEVGKTTRLRYLFDWGSGIAFYYEKVHGRNGYRWFGACHEYPVPDRIDEVWAQSDKLLVIHQPDPSKSRGQYLDLLRVATEEHPNDPRNGFYYARELSFNARWAEAIVQGMRYLNLHKATWANERCYAMRTIGRCYAELGQTDSAREWFVKASQEAPQTREPWCELAMLDYRREDWRGCYEAATQALAITNREQVYTVDPHVWGAQPHDLLAISAWWLGKPEEALRQAVLALEHEPDNERLKANLAMMQTALAA